MTAINMKQSSVDLINQIDERDTELLEKVFLFLTANVHQQKERQFTANQKRRLSIVERYAGAFSAAKDKDWKKEKEEYLLDKYGK